MAWTSPGTAVVGGLLTASFWNGNVRDNLNAASPVGKYSYVAAIAGAAGSANAWQGAWLECNGTAVSRTTYAALFNYLNGLSTALPFGVGDGSTTFNLPDLSGRTPVSQSPSTGDASVKTIGNNDGVTVANRRGTKHRHTPHVHDLHYQDSGSPGGTRNLLDGTANTAIDHGGQMNSADGGSGVSTDPLDGGAYLVGGIWVIKALA